MTTGKTNDVAKFTGFPDEAAKARQAQDQTRERVRALGGLLSAILWGVGSYYAGMLALPTLLLLMGFTGAVWITPIAVGLGVFSFSSVGWGPDFSGWQTDLKANAFRVFARAFLMNAVNYPIQWVAFTAFSLHALFSGFAFVMAYPARWFFRDARDSWTFRSAVGQMVRAPAEPFGALLTWIDWRFFVPMREERVRVERANMNNKIKGVLAENEEKDPQNRSNQSINALKEKKNLEQQNEILSRVGRCVGLVGISVLVTVGLSFLLPIAGMLSFIGAWAGVFLFGQLNPTQTVTRVEEGTFWWALAVECFRMPVNAMLFPIAMPVLVLDTVFRKATEFTQWIRDILPGDKKVIGVGIVNVSENSEVPFYYSGQPGSSLEQKGKPVGVDVDVAPVKPSLGSLDEEKQDRDGKEPSSSYSTSLLSSGGSDSRNSSANSTNSGGHGGLYLLPRSCSPPRPTTSSDLNGGAVGPPEVKTGGFSSWNP